MEPGEPAPVLGVVLIDIDHFKRLNDAAGHAAGDDCLAAMAARYGGEEFICVVGGATPRAILQFGEALRTGVEALACPHPGLGAARTVTISIGLAVAVSDRTPDGLGRLIREADAALYRAKDEGRNRVVPAWEPIGLVEPPVVEAGLRRRA